MQAQAPVRSTSAGGGARDILDRVTSQQWATPAPKWQAFHSDLRALLSTPSPDASAVRALVLALHDTGAPPAARVEVLEWATAAFPPSSLVAPDQWSFLDELAASRDLGCALAAAALLPRRLASHNRLVYALCTASRAEPARLDDALRVLNHMRSAAGPAPSLATYRNLLGACGDAGRTSEVLRLLSRCAADGCVLSRATTAVQRGSTCSRRQHAQRFSRALKRPLACSSQTAV